MKKILFLLFTTMPTSGFDLQTAQKYVAHRLEYPQPDNKNVYNPDFASWHSAHTPSAVQNLLEKVGLSKPLWSAQQFIDVLKSLTSFREAEGYAYPHEIWIKARPESTFIIFGPVFASFHSLVRSLTELKRQKRLTDQLRLMNPHTYLIFNGNVIDGAPYSLETLTLVMQLMQANPHQVFYNKGEHESADYWMGYGLRDELTLRIGDYSLEKLVSRFFATLPQAVLIESPKNNDGVIRIAHYSTENQRSVRSECITKSAKNTLGTVFICPLQAKEGAKLPLKAEIVAERRIRSYERHPGLVMATGETGAPAWYLFSAPNALFKRHFSFYYDAFVVLIIGNNFDESVLVLYNQDVREQGGFKNASRYAPVSGKSLITYLEAPAGELTLIPSKKVETQLKACKKTSDLERAQKKAVLEKDPIIIGCTLDLSKGASGQGKLVKEGVSIGINRANRMGGINGRLLKVVFMDDEYVPEKARQNVEHFVKTYKSTLFLCNLGSPTMQAYLDLVRDNKIFVFFPVTGAPLFRKPDLTGVVHWMASYKSEARVLTRYLLNTLAITDFGFLYQDDAYGQGALEGANEVLKMAGITKVTSIGYERNTTFFKPQIEKLKGGVVHGLGFFSTALAATEFIRQAGVDFFIGKKLCALSDLAEESFKAFAHQKGLDIIIASFCPNPATSQLEIVKDFRAAVYQQGNDRTDVFMLGGYIAVSLAVDILTKASPSITHESIIKVIKGMNNYHYKGFNLTFDPQTKELAHKLWLDTGAPQWIEQSVRV